MKYLVIGDSNSMHIFNFVKTFLVPRGYEIHLLTLSTKSVRDMYRDYYRENGITLHSIAEKGYKGLDKTNRIYRLLNLWRKMRLMKDVPVVDVCHIQSVYKTSIMMALKNKRKFKKLILSYWGSDILERTPKILEMREKCFELADAITVTVEAILNDFHEIHGNRFDDKLRISRLSTDGLSCINSLSKSVTREDCRKAYNVPEGKIVVTCGYSATAEQHQDRCLEELQKLPQELRDKIHVIVPMQYGPDDPEYMNRVENAKAASELSCDILKTYVPFEESAKLAIATDIFLQLRDTDAFSNALKEHVYSGSFIVSGTWLRYIELEKMGVPLRKISDFNQLTDTMADILADYTIPEGINLFEPIYNLYSTESVVGQWGSVVDSVM